MAQRPGALAGQLLVPLFHPQDQDGLLEHMGAVISGASTPRREVNLPDGTSVTLAASLFRQDRTTQLLVRLTPESHVIAHDEAPGVALHDVVERIPDAFVLADQHMVIQAVNAAFLDLTHLPRADQAVGEPLDRFLGRPGIDLDLIAGQLRTDGTVRNFETLIRARDGEMEDVEISAVSVDSDGRRQFGFAIRSIARRLGRPESSADMPRSVEQLTELVGRVSLKDIVRESTDLIERLCIEAALRFTSNNRASAAEILGLSRQSLYSKLHRHGIANTGLDADD
jgi:transcriptional regulator PpsR